MERKVFSTLQSGTRFDRNRFQDTFELFEEGSPCSWNPWHHLTRAERSAVSANGSGSGKRSTLAPAASLNFFGDEDLDIDIPAAKAEEELDDDSSSVSEASSATASEESEAEESDSENDEDAVQVFGGRAAKAVVKKKDKKTMTAEKKERIRQEGIRAFRRQLKLKVSGGNIPDPMQTFAALPTKVRRVKDAIVKNVEASAFKEPTTIQMQSIPCMLLGRDTLAIAPTGSGKTASFLLPTFCKLNRRSKDGARALIVSPTRELALQTLREAERLAVGTGLKIVVLSRANMAGAKSNDSATGLPRADIIITTPLRLASVLDGGRTTLPTVQSLILDEADKLFEMGFIDQVDSIIAACTNEKLQRAMFSATMPQGIEALVASVLRDHVKISVGVTGAGASTIKQRLLFVGREEGKLLAMRQLVAEGLKPPVLVFLQSKERAKELYNELRYDNINVDVIHSDRTQTQRDQAVNNFRTGETWVLIATDLMCRGMDFKGIKLVINYDFPQSIVSYVHRIGRTGRAGRPGEAVTFFTESDMEYLRSIANVMRISGCDVPEWMLTMKKLSNNKKKELKRRAPKRHHISTVSRFDRQRAARKRSAVRSKQGSKRKVADKADGGGSKKKKQRTD